MVVTGNEDHLLMVTALTVDSICNLSIDTQLRSGLLGLV